MKKEYFIITSPLCSLTIKLLKNMSVTMSLVGLLAVCLFFCISFFVQEEVESQVTKMAGILSLFLTFLFSHLWIKLIMVVALIFTWSSLSDMLGLSFHREINK